MNKQAITVQVGNDEVTFNVGMDDYNNYMDSMLPNDKVSPAYNFLSDTVDEAQQDSFKTLCTKDNQPNGPIVMAILSAVVEEFSDDVVVKVKKPKASTEK